MNCLKCGRELPEGEVFCESCAAVMKKHPVDPQTSLQLPRRPEQDAAKKGPRRKASAEERLAKSKKAIRALALVIAVLAVVICLLAGAVAQLYERVQEADNLGKNYTTQETQ